ncbi:unnamed protein product [Rotaria sordida]|uniref:Uncharacterized protein n=1 Tax=Rotaria sordida TaxID=392033 RepID=A0A819MRD6_9BILA|nr:unnamed protein product [Rotaria sordida]CAF3983456.1 unnamed protein product [Rotaria sordida]
MSETSISSSVSNAHVLALVGQLRLNTKLKKDEQLRQYVFDIRTTKNREIGILTSLATQANHFGSFENEILFAKTGHFNLDK